MKKFIIFLLLCSGVVLSGEFYSQFKSKLDEIKSMKDGNEKREKFKSIKKEMKDAIKIKETMIRVLEKVFEDSNDENVKEALREEIKKRQVDNEDIKIFNEVMEMEL